MSESKSKSDPSLLKFYLTHPHPCSYLPHQTSTTLFLDPFQPIDVSIYQQLTDKGFRRSGNYLYQPKCNDCQACLPVRILVDDFVPNKAQRRILRKNAHLSFSMNQSNAFRKEQYALYHKYIVGRHHNGDMFPPSEQQYRSFLYALWSKTQFIEFRAREKLVAVAVTDYLEKGLSAIYTFFDPNLASQSLGTFAILHQIELAKSLNLNYLYLGYWVKNSPKMCYKTNFTPLEYYDGTQWRLLSSNAI